MEGRDKARLAAKIGARIASLRIDAGLTQAHLAELVGIGDEAVSRFERGMAIPTLPRLFDFALALDSRVDDFLLAASPRPDEQAIAIARRIAQLPAADREFVVETVERLARHMSHKPFKRSRR